MRLLSFTTFCALLLAAPVFVPAQDIATPNLQEWQRRQDEAALANIRAQRDVMYRAAPQPAAVNTGVRPTTPVLSLTATPTLSEPLRLYYVPDFTEEQKKESDSARGFWANARNAKSKPAPAGETEGATVMPLKDGEAVAEVAQVEGADTPGAGAEVAKTEENGFFSRRFGRNNHGQTPPPADPDSAPVDGDAAKPAESATPPAEGDPTELADATVSSKAQRKTLGSLFRKNQPASERTEVAAIGSGLEEKKDPEAEKSETHSRFLAAFRKPKDAPAEGTEADTPEEETVDAKTEKNETTDQYMAINQMQAPFHVFDEEPGETFIIELSQNTIGRVQSHGEEWAWLQLDSGLMGVMKNKSLRPAKRSEVLAFLAVESGGSSTPYTKPPVQYVDVNLPELPSMAQAQTEMPLGHGLLPPVGSEDTTPAGADEPKMAPLFQSKGFDGDELSIGSATMSADEVAASVAKSLEEAAAKPAEVPAAPKAEGEPAPAPAGESAPTPTPTPTPAAPGEMKASDIAGPSTFASPAPNSPALTGQLSFDQLQMLLPPAEPKKKAEAPTEPKPEAAPAPAPTPEAPKAKETEEVEMIEVTVEETPKPTAEPAPAPAAGS